MAAGAAVIQGGEPAGEFGHSGVTATRRWPHYTEHHTEHRKSVNRAAPFRERLPGSQRHARPADLRCQSCRPLSGAVTQGVTIINAPTAKCQSCRPLSGAVTRYSGKAAYEAIRCQSCRPLSGAVTGRTVTSGVGLPLCQSCRPLSGAVTQCSQEQNGAAFPMSIVPPPFGSGYPKAPTRHWRSV